MFRLFAMLLCFCFSLGSAPVRAQNLLGVFGPTVAEDDRSAEIRSAFVPGEDGEPDRWAARIHYQHSLTDSLRLRGILQGADNGVDGFKTNAFQGEVMWQLTPDGRPLQFGLRGDARMGWNGVSDLLSLNATADYRIDEKLSVRGLVMSQKILGETAPDSLQWQTRGRIAYRTAPATLALEYYGLHGSLGAGGMPDQMQAGPVVTIPMDRFYLSGGYLAGLNDDTPDSDFRLWIGYRF